MNKGSGYFGLTVTKSDRRSSREPLMNLTNAIENFSKNIRDEVHKELSDDIIVLMRSVDNGYNNIPDIDGGIDSLYWDVYEIIDGWQVAISGDKLLYKEFGTGEMGMRHPYPDSDILSEYNWEYASGDKVHTGGYTDDVNDNDIPAWYKSAIDRGNWYNKKSNDSSQERVKVTPSSYVWMTPKGNVTHGIKPGKVWHTEWLRMSKAHKGEVSMKDYFSRKKFRRKIVETWEDSKKG